MGEEADFLIDQGIDDLLRDDDEMSLSGGGIPSNATYTVPYSEILAETDKAVLIQLADLQIRKDEFISDEWWLPKSRCEINKKKKQITLPLWLFKIKVKEYKNKKE